MKKLIIVILILSGAFSCNTRNESLPVEKESESIDLSIVTESYLDAPPNADILEYQKEQFRKQYAQYEFDKIFNEIMKDERMTRIIEISSLTNSTSLSRVKSSGDFGFSSPINGYINSMTSLLPTEQEVEIDVNSIQQGLENIKTEINEDVALSEEDKQALLGSADMYIQNLAGMIMIYEQDSNDSSGRISGWFTNLLSFIYTVVVTTVVGAIVGAYTGSLFGNPTAGFVIGGLIGLFSGIQAVLADRCYDITCPAQFKSCSTGICV